MHTLRKHRRDACATDLLVPKLRLGTPLLPKLSVATIFVPKYNLGTRGKKRNTMPTISMFFGIIIRMYFSPDEHPPPHFHAYYNEYRATVDIRTCEIIKSDLPRK